MKKILLFLFPFFAFLFFSISVSAKEYEVVYKYQFDSSRLFEYHYQFTSDSNVAFCYSNSEAGSGRCGFFVPSGTTHFSAQVYFNGVYNRVEEYQSGSWYAPQGMVFISANCPVFSSYSAMQNYLLNGVGSGDIFQPLPDYSFDPFDYDYDSSIPTPILTLNNNFNLSFVNGDDSLGVVAYTRWKSIDNIYLYYDTLGGYDSLISAMEGTWNYRYNTIISGDLVESISLADDFYSNSGLSLFGDYPSNPSPFTNSFSSFLSAHPVSSRTIDSSPLVNLGFSAFDSMYQNFLSKLSDPTVRFNVPEIYFRYYKYVDGVPVFGKWTYFSFSSFDKSGVYVTNQDYKYGKDTGGSSLTIDDNTPNITTSTDGYTNDQVTNNSIDNTVNIRPITNTINFDYETPDFTDALNSFRSALGLFANFSDFVKMCFAFLPDWMITMLGSTITMLCGLSIYHGIRG